MDTRRVSFVLRWMSGFLSDWFVAEVVVMVMVMVMVMVLRC
jgi:hypothetical protein